jgi:hypothetical protein
MAKKNKQQQKSATENHTAKGRRGARANEKRIHKQNVAYSYLWSLLKNKLVKQQRNQPILTIFL